MFGFSLTKLLFTIAAVVIVWQGFKWFNRMQDNRAVDAANRPRRAEQKPSSQAPRGGANTGEAEEMVKCSVCDTYVSSASAVNCGKANCPYPG